MHVFGLYMESGEPKERHTEKYEVCSQTLGSDIDSDPSVQHFILPLTPGAVPPIDTYYCIHLLPSALRDHVCVTRLLNI